MRGAACLPVGVVQRRAERGARVRVAQFTQGLGGIATDPREGVAKSGDQPSAIALLLEGEGVGWFTEEPVK